MHSLPSVICVSKTDRFNPHERIREVGLDNGQRLTVDDVLAAMDRGNAFYVASGGKPVAVVPAVHLGRRYIKTEADGIQPNNLLALPECI